MAFLTPAPLSPTRRVAGASSQRLQTVRPVPRYVPAATATPHRLSDAAAAAAAAATTPASATSPTSEAATSAPTAARKTASSKDGNAQAQGATQHHHAHMPGAGDPSLMDPVHERRDRVRGDPVAIIVLGASGDLAKKKTFPAIFSLYYHDLLPDDFVLYGFARREMTHEDFRELILGTLSCRVIDGAKCAAKMEEFLPRCFYHRGNYADVSTFESLNETLASQFEQSHSTSNRLFYMAVPPSVFHPCAASINSSARASNGWTRVVVEKPFGRDSESYQQLRSQLEAELDEDETYRIDHFLAKVLVQNMMTLRFANAIFEPVWNRHHIKSVQIVFKEHFGVEGRAGYFDDVGIIRDIMQNHLLQILALLAMEPPVSLHAEDIRDEKVKALRAIRPLSAADFAIGQYGPKDSNSPGYLDDDGVPPESRTPTFASCVMHLDNARWEGVPFMMKAGKALDERKTEIRIQFKDAPGSLFNTKNKLSGNELVIRVQPDEAIFLRIVSKVPGLTSRVEEARLNLFYHHAWEESKDIPDAYERLILDVIQGEKALFIRDDELEVAWDIFTPALKELEQSAGRKPVTYEYGSTGPTESDQLAEKHGVAWSE